MSSPWTPVTRDNPCPICGKPDWCATTQDGAVRCMRATAAPPGWRLVKTCADDGHVFRPSEAATLHAKSKHGRNWARDAEHFSRRLGEERLNALARDLCVATAALRSIQVGWNGRSYTFPEYGESGAIIGIATRDMTGRKRTAKGSRRGLIIPLGFDQLPDPVVVVEGPTDVASLLSMGITAVGRPSARAGSNALKVLLKGREVIVLGEHDRKTDGSWPGRDGAESVACKLAETWKQPVTWALPPDGTKDARDFLVKSRQAMSNLDLRALGEDLLRQLSRHIAHPPKEAKLTTREPRRRLAVQLVELILESNDLCVTPTGRPYLIPGDPHGGSRALEVGSEGLDLLLTSLAWSKLEQAPSTECLRDVGRVLTAKAREGPTRRVWHRVAHQDGAIYLDLGNDECDVIVVDAESWRLAKDVPVLFERRKHMMRIPRPVTGGRMEELAAFLNLERWDDYVLVISWLLASLRGKPPYPILVLEGEPGSAKSTTARILKELIDPSATRSRGAPRTEQDLGIAARHDHILIFDNLSALTPSLSDGLCRLSTGGCVANRELYTNSGEIVLDLGNPALITAVTNPVTRGDLLDRCLCIQLPRLYRTSRRTEDDHLRDFEEARPRLLGALLDAVCAALSCSPTTTFDGDIRMLDFARWAAAAEDALGWFPGTVATALTSNKRNADIVAIEASSLATALLAWLEAGPVAHCEMTVSELDAAIKAFLKPDWPTDWPRGPAQFSAALRRLAPNLRHEGVTVQFTRSGGRRLVRIDGRKYVGRLAEGAA